VTQECRVETGKMQFEDDWPGVFIRGDDALGYAAIIHSLMANGPPRNLSDEKLHDWTALLELAELLESCRHKGKSPRRAKSGTTQTGGANEREIS